VENLARFEKMRNSFNLKRRDQLKDTDVNGKIILKWFLNMVCLWTGLIWLRIGALCVP
jgi:hypothetical protein